MKVVIDDCKLERMDACTEPLNDKIKRQAAEITRLLKENEELKEKLHEEHYDFVWQSGYSKGISEEEEKWKENVEIIRDNAFEAGRIRGNEEAWELMKKMVIMYCNDLVKVFDSDEPWEIITRFSYAEAAEKVAEYERQNEICVGDVVRFKENHRIEFCVTDIDDDRFLYGINAEGGVYADRDIELFEKTGKHIDVPAWLAQIRGGTNETEN